MKKVFSLIVILIYNFSFSQNKDLNVILFLNNELVENISDFQIIDNSDLIYSCQYYIGNLTMSSDDFNKINNGNSQKLSFKFKIFENEKRGFERKDYEVKFDKLLLNRKYFVIRIYNRDYKVMRTKLKNKSLEYSYNIYTDGVCILNI